MDSIERAVVAPQIKIVEKSAAWRQIFRDRPNKRLDMRPFVVGQIARIS